MACWALLLLAPSLCTDAQGPVGPEDGTPSSTAPVATVTVSPSGATIRPGGAIQLSATLRDSAGNALTNRSIAWSSSNTDIATVSSSGGVTGVTEGLATVTATSEGKSGISSLQVVSASSTYPNEPAGFTSWFEHDFSCIPGADGCQPLVGEIILAQGTSGWELVDDQSAPGSPFYVRQKFPDGWVAGNAPGRFFMADNASNPTRLSEWYIALWIMLEGPAWEWPPAEQKFWYQRWGNLETSTRGHFVLRNDAAADGEIVTGAVPYASTRSCESCSITLHVPQVSGNPFTIGQWHLVEEYRKLGTVGQNNGIFRTWLDGNLIMAYTNVKTEDPGDSQPGFGLGVLHWEPIYGGVGYSKTRDDWMRLGHVYISGKPQ